MFIIIIIFFLIFFINFNFFYKKSELKNEIISKKEEKKYEIDYNYERISPKDDKYIYIPIIATNDIHGKFFPELNEMNIKGKKIEYKTGGLEYIARYINILRNELGDNKVLYFDSGDQFYQSNETILFKGKNIFDFLNTIGLNGTTLGNHEYLYKKEWIENIIKEAKYPYLINNIKENINNKTKNVFGENQKNSKIYEIKLNKEEIIKIGVIGITMQVGEDKRFYNIGHRETWNNISFESHYYNLEKESKKLKEKGANAIILLSHIGLECHNINETSKINMYNKNIKQSECQKDGNSLLYKFIKGLKKGIIDGIIGGDTHNNIHHWIDDIPIMISKGKAKYINIMYLPFKKENNKYILINDEIKIEGPLPSCEKIFKDVNNCEMIENNNNKKIELINYYWHNEKMGKDIKTKLLFDKYYNLYKKSEEKKIGKIIGFNEKIQIDYTGDSLLGNLIMDIIRNITKSDISIANYWMFQNYLSPGDLSILDFIKIIPQDNYICTTEMKGKEIKIMIKSIQKGERFQPSSGLKQFVKYNEIKKEKEIIDIKLYNKDNNIEDVEDDKIYTLSSNNYVLSEFCEREFKEKDYIVIIKEKKRMGKIKCSKLNTYIDIMNYFKNKGIIDINKDIDMTKKRIVYVD